MHKNIPTPADLILTAELLRSKIDLMESGRPLTPQQAWQHAGAYSIRLRRRYTVSRVCRAWGLSRTTLYRRQRQAKRSKPPSRPPPTDSHIVARLRDWIAHTPFPAERHRKLWARLRHLGVAVSRERVRRLVRQHQLLPQPGAGILTKRPNVMWGIDSAKVRTDLDGFVFVLFAVDHCTSECLAIDAVLEETAPAWHHLIKRALRYASSGPEPTTAVPAVIVRHDNLNLFRSREFRDPIRRLHIRCSAIPPLYPQGNACAERFARTLRENLLSIRSFSDVVTLRSEVGDFRRTYNTEWLLTRWNYASPRAVRSRFQSGTLSEAARPLHYAQ